MTDTPKYGAGRPTKDPERLKRSRTLSFTDAEYEKLGELANAARLGRSEYIIEMLGLAPVPLSDFKSNFSEYDYYIISSITSSEKISVFREFLKKFKDDCNFSMTLAEPNQHLHGVLCTAYSTSGNERKTIFIVLASDREHNKQEYLALRKEWVNVLELSLDLEDKWNGSNYSVYKRLTLEGKQRLLKQFVEKYKGSHFDSNDSFGGGTAFKVLASRNTDKHELIIEYLPERGKESDYLTNYLLEYIQ
jgi:hypothetical protein